MLLLLLVMKMSSVVLTEYYRPEAAFVQEHVTEKVMSRRSVVGSIALLVRRFDHPQAAVFCEVFRRPPAASESVAIQRRSQRRCPRNETRTPRSQEHARNTREAHDNGRMTCRLPVREGILLCVCECVWSERFAAGNRGMGMRERPDKRVGRDHPESRNERRGATLPDCALFGYG